MRELLIVKTGSTFSALSEQRGDFEDWIIDALGCDRGMVRIVTPYRDERLPDPGDFSGIVITGSHAMVTDRDGWAVRTARWIPEAVEAETPLMAICFGHQLLAVAMGGEAADLPGGSVFGTVPVDLTAEAADDPLLTGFDPGIRLHATHTQFVAKLPPGALLLGSAPKDPNHAFSIGPSTWSFQFHPEHGADIVLAYIEKCRDLLLGQGQDPESLKEEVEDTPHGAVILERFGDLVRRHG